MPLFKCKSIVVFMPQGADYNKAQAYTLATYAVTQAAADHIADLTFAAASAEDTFAKVLKELVDCRGQGDLYTPPPTTWNYGPGGLHENSQPLTTDSAYAVPWAISVPSTTPMAPDIEMLAYLRVQSFEIS